MTQTLEGFSWSGSPWWRHCFRSLTLVWMMSDSKGNQVGGILSQTALQRKPFSEACVFFFRVEAFSHIRLTSCFVGPCCHTVCRKTEGIVVMASSCQSVNYPPETASQFVLFSPYLWNVWLWFPGPLWSFKVSLQTNKQTDKHKKVKLLPSWWEFSASFFCRNPPKPTNSCLQSVQHEQRLLWAPSVHRGASYCCSPASSDLEFMRVKN